MNSSTKKLLYTAAGAITAAMLASCATNKELPVILKEGEVSSSADNAKSHELFAKGKKAYYSNKFNSASDKFRKLYRKYPLSQYAAESIYLRGLCLEKDKKHLLAFDEYQKIATRYTLSGFYKKAIDRQIAIAQGAFDKDLKEHFLFLSASISETQIIKLLEKVIANAPNSRSAVKSQDTIAEIYSRRKSPDDAVIAYEQLVFNYPTAPEAAEAQFKIGELLIAQADSGNQDSANINRAKQAFKDLLTLYPNSSKATLAKQRIRTLELQELERSLDTGNFYLRKKQFTSAKVYFDKVIDAPNATATMKDEARKALSQMK